MENRSVKVAYSFNEVNFLQSLFFTFKYMIQRAVRLHDNISIDAAYRMRNLHMPLIWFYGISNTDQQTLDTCPIAFSWAFNQTDDAHSFFIEHWNLESELLVLWRELPDLGRELQALERERELFYCKMYSGQALLIVFVRPGRFPTAPFSWWMS